MSDPMRDHRELLRQALDRTSGCPTLEALTASTQDAPTKRHVEECPHCRAELAMFQQFESAEAQPAEAADLAWMELELARRSPARLASGESFGDRVRAWFESLLSPAGHGRLGLATAALLVLVAAGVVLRPGGGVHQAPSEESRVWRSGQFAAQSPSGDLNQSPLQLRWEAVPGAVSYHVRLLEVDGTEVWSADAAATSIDFPHDIVQKLTPGRAFQWDAVARDAAGRKLAATDLQIFHILATRR